MASQFLTDLFNRRGKPSIGANPQRFIELAGGQEVFYNFFEPDANTWRDPYYYNTRLNVLYKNVEATNPRKIGRAHV